MPTCKVDLRGVVALVKNGDKLNVLIPDGRRPRLASTVDAKKARSVFTLVHTACLGFGADDGWEWDKDSPGAFKPIDAPVRYEHQSAHRSLIYLEHEHVVFAPGVAGPFTWSFNPSELAPVSGVLDPDCLKTNAPARTFANIEFSSGTLTQMPSSVRWEMRPADSMPGPANKTRASRCRVAFPFANPLSIRVASFDRARTYELRTTRADDLTIDVFHLEMASIVGNPPPLETPSTDPDRDFELLYDFCKPGFTLDVPHPELRVPSQAGGGDAARCMPGFIQA